MHSVSRTCLKVRHQQSDVSLYMIIRKLLDSEEAYLVGYNAV
jgi:hypothetical protein